MKAVSQKAQGILDKLAELARVAGGHTRLDDRPGVYMALVVEWLGKDRLSVAHYGTQNGDAMRDPEMVFWKGCDGKWYPTYFLNDYAGAEVTSVEFGDDGKPAKIRPKQQADQAVFAGIWMNNIHHQQGV